MKGISDNDTHAELREGVRALCNQFDGAYWQKVDEERGYPEAFVDALTKTVAVKMGDRYVVNGQKVWTSRVQHSELMILLARTTPLAEVKKKSEGMSIFLVETKSKGLEVKPIRNMVNHETNEGFIANLEIPAENLIGEEGKGFSKL